MPIPDHILRLMRRTGLKQKAQPTKEMNPQDIKSPFKSKTMVGLAITVIGFIAGFFKVNVDETAAKDLIDYLDQSWPALTQAAGILFAAYGRFKANKVISMKAVTLVGMTALFLIPGTTVAQDKTVITDPVIQEVDKMSGSFFADAFSTGFLPTGANQPLALNGVDYDQSVGGGVSIGYQFNPVVSLSIMGQWFWSTNTMVQQYTVDLMVFLPPGEGFNLLPDFIQVPYAADSQLYAIMGAGVHVTDFDTDSLVRAGLGVQMPLKEGSKIHFFIDATVNVVGLSGGDNLEPFVTARSGLRIPF